MIETEKHARLLDRTAQVLAELGRSRAEVADVTPLLGRNTNASIRFDDGETVFVKRITGLGAENRHFRSTSFHHALDLPRESPHFRTPLLLAEHAGTSTLAYEHVPEGTGFGQQVRDDEVSTADLERAGRCLAALHSITVHSVEKTDSSMPYLPPHGPNALTFELFYGSTMGQLEMWRLIQSDELLRERLDTLVTSVHAEQRVPIHGDLRGDQILMSDSECWMLDWEEFRLGDPARDVGAMIGEIFYHRMRSSISEFANDAASVEDADIIQWGTHGIESSLPAAQTLWNAYASAGSGTIDEDFVGRCVGYFGWQLFDRALASGTYFGRISALDRALAGIGREAIKGGVAYGATLGLITEEFAA